MIKVVHLSKHFNGVKAVNDISFQVKEQENMILLGTSGCGKTTTLKMINRLIAPTSGQILINGKSIFDESPEVLRRGIGYVLQNNGLFPHYTVAENIAIVPKLLKWDDKRIESRTHELIDKLHLSASYLHVYPNELSGGQQQRIGLARALVADPPILLMDEPFGALDNVTRASIHKEFKALDELKRKTIIMVTHDVQEAFELGDHICLMDQGHIVQDGTPAELLLKPANDFVTSFLKEQRLQLEFRAIKPPPPPEGGTFELQGKSYFADVSLWTLMEQLDYSNNESITIFDQEHNQVGTLNFEQLMAAFYQYKSTVSHE